MWSGVGAETVEIIPSLQSMLLAHQGWRGKGSAAVRQTVRLIEESAAGHEIVVHIFSNNGFVFFGSVLQAAPGISTKMSAVIIDSAPSYITPDNGATALLAAVRRIEADKAAHGVRWNILRGAMIPVMALLERRQNAAWSAWKAHCPRAPHLFIFSEQDAMVPPDDIQVFADEHTRHLDTLNQASEVKRWEAGKHCGLYLLNKARYLQEVMDFLQRSA